MAQKQAHSPIQTFVFVEDGILASNVTLKVLHEYQVVVYRMISGSS